MKVIRDKSSTRRDRTTLPTDRERLRWLLDFVQKDPALLRQLKANERTHIVGEMQAFIDFPWEGKRIIAMMGTGSKWSNNDIARLAADVRSGIENNLHGKGWRIDLAPAELRKHRIALSLQNHFQWFGYEIFGREAFRLCALLLLVKEADRILTCGRCGRLFCRQKRGKFCSPECNRLSKMADFIRSKGGLECYKAYRREQYVKRVREAKGNKNIKVGRRRARS